MTYYKLNAPIKQGIRDNKPFYVVEIEEHKYIKGQQCVTRKRTIKLEDAIRILGYCGLKNTYDIEWF